MLCFSDSTEDLGSKLGLFGEVSLVLSNIVFINVSEIHILSLFGHSQFSECGGSWPYGVEGYFLRLFKLVLRFRVDILPEVSGYRSIPYMVGLGAIEGSFGRWLRSHID